MIKDINMRRRNLMLGEREKKVPIRQNLVMELSRLVSIIYLIENKEEKLELSRCINSLIETLNLTAKEHILLNYEVYVGGI